MDNLDVNFDEDVDDEVDSRAPRSTRETEQRPQAESGWRPASHLPDPPQRPGYVHRWVRMSHGAVSDQANMAKAMREGWRIAPPSEYPELTDIIFDRSGNSELIEFGGLVLCRISEELAKQRTAYFTNLARRQLSSIGARLRDAAGNDERLQFETKVKTEVKRTAH